MVQDPSAVLDHCEARLEDAVWDGDHAGRMTEAREILDDVLKELQAVETEPGSAAEQRRQGLIAFLYMRLANVLRQERNPEEAAEADRSAMQAAEQADDLSRGRCIISMAATAFASDRADEGLALLADARESFAAGDGSDHRQGLGWTFILEADVINADLVARGPWQAMEAASRALTILRQIDNWAGVARAYRAMSSVEERLGNDGPAAALRSIADSYDGLAAEERR